MERWAFGIPGIWCSIILLLFCCVPFFCSTPGGHDREPDVVMARAAVTCLQEKAQAITRAALARLIISDDDCGVGYDSFSYTR